MGRRNQQLLSEYFIQLASHINKTTDYTIRPESQNKTILFLAIAVAALALILLVQTIKEIYKRIVLEKETIFARVGC